jgi:hypothetical protein
VEGRVDHEVHPEQLEVVGAAAWVDAHVCCAKGVRCDFADLGVY